MAGGDKTQTWQLHNHRFSDAPEVVPPSSPEVAVSDAPELRPSDVAKGNKRAAVWGGGPDKDEAPTSAWEEDGRWAGWRRPRRCLVAAAALAALVVVAVVLGAVLGTQLGKTNDQSRGSGAATTTTTTTPAPAPAPTALVGTASGGPITTPSLDDMPIGKVLTSSFTYYGSNDFHNSSSCNSVNNPCGFYTSPGYAAAVSQNLFGPAVAPIACGTCWSLVPRVDNNGLPIPNSSTIVVVVNNICPAEGNQLCAQPNLTAAAANDLGAVVDFNLCVDSGASAAFFGQSGVGLGVGTATRVDCAEWQGSKVGGG